MEREGPLTETLFEINRTNRRNVKAYLTSDFGNTQHYSVNPLVTKIHAHRTMSQKTPIYFIISFADE